jgi:hypothetical protein
MADVPRFVPPSSLGRVRNGALAIGVAALGLVLLMPFTGMPARFVAMGLLAAFVFWTGISVGALGLLFLQFVSRGAWGVLIRRILEAATLALPVMALVFVAIAAVAPHIYEWAGPEFAAHDTAGRTSYLNAPFFALRGALCFAVWMGAAWLLRRWSAREEQDSSDRYCALARRLSGPGLVLYAITVTVVSTDWVMSLDPHWTSSIFGMIFMVGWALSALAFVIVAVRLLATRSLHDAIGTQLVHDLGNLLFAFLFLYIYVHFSQLIIIWSANLPEEAPWYVRRMTGGWDRISLTLFLLEALLPFLLLLQRPLKRRLRPLATIAGLLLLMRVLDTWYFVLAETSMPGVGRNIGPSLPLSGWLAAAAAIVGIGGLWLGAFATALARQPLIPQGDPLFARLLRMAGAPARPLP